jgi:hypothetical protein
MMPLLTPPPPPGTVVRGDKRRLAVIVTAVVAVLAAVGIWSAVRPGSYGESRAGCVTVTIPSSTGGGLLHECGASARRLCPNAVTSEDRLALLVRPACRRAGLA